MSSKASYLEALETIKLFCEQEENFSKTEAIAQVLSQSFLDGNKILACGNGGSACDAMHLCEEFTGQYRKRRKALPAISLTDASHITCVGNDFGFEEIFSRGVEAFGKSGDWLFALSTSGNSKNIIKAVDLAKQQDMTVVTLLGKDGGQLKGQADYEFIIPAQTSDRIQEVHMTILHIIIEGVERRLFAENY